MAQVRKRARRTLVCMNCRRNKSKCDRNHPCSRCIKSGLQASCVYEDSPPFIRDSPPNDSGALSSDGRDTLTVDKSILETLLKRVESVESNLRALPVTSYRRSSLLLLPQSGFSSDKSLVFNLRRALNTNALGEFKSNRWRGMLWQFVMVFGDPSFNIMRGSSAHSDSLHFSFFSIYEDDLTLLEIPLDQLDDLSQKYFGRFHIRRLLPNPMPSDITDLMHQISIQKINPGICYNPTLTWRNHTLLDQIRELMPPYLHTREIVRLFFKWQLPGYQFCVPNIIYSSLERIFNIDNDLLRDKVTISSSSDVAVIACVFLMIRITTYSLTNPYNGVSIPDLSAPNLGFLGTIRSTIDLVELAEKLVHELEPKVDVNFQVFQAVSLLFVYRLICPEGDQFRESGDVGAYFAEIVYLSKALGFNEVQVCCQEANNIKESENVPDYYKQRTWMLLLVLDCFLACFFGTNLAIRHDECDFSVFLQNGTYWSEQDDISQVLFKMMPLCKLAHEICEKVFQLSSLCPVSELIDHLNNLETLIFDTFGGITRLFEKTSSLSFRRRATYMNLAVLFLCFYLCLCYSLYVFFETNGNFDLSSFYSRKFIRTVFGTLGFVQKGLLITCETFFGYASWLYFSPIVLICNKLHLLAILVRIRFASTLRDHDSKYDNNAKKSMNVILSKLLGYEEQSIGFAAYFGQYQNNAWWNFKSFRFGQHVITKLESSEQYLALCSKARVRFSLEEIQRWEEDLHEIDKQAEFYRSVFKAEKTNIALPRFSVLDIFHMDNYWYGVNCVRLYFKDAKFNSMFTESQPAGEKLSQFYYESDVFGEFPFV